MAVPYLPARDADLLTWSQAFSSQITATPTAFGLVAGQATTLSGYVTAYNTALQTATNEATRTRATVASKDVAKFNLRSTIQSLVAIIQGYPSITESQLSALGLTVRSTTRTPISTPTTYPLLNVVSIQQLQANLVIADQLTPDSRSKPANVVGCQVYYQAGGVAPVSLATMTFAGMLTKTPTALELPPAVLGLQVYFRCRWVTARGLVGPTSPLVSAIAA